MAAPYVRVYDFTAGQRVRSSEVDNELDAVATAFLKVLAGAADVGVDSGTANEIILTHDTARTTNVQGDLVVWEALNSNAGTVTIQIDSISAVALVNKTGAALSSGDIVATNFYEARYNASDSAFQLMNATPGVVASLTQIQGISTSSPDDGDGTYTATLPWKNNASVPDTLASIGFSGNDFRFISNVEGGNITFLTEKDAGAALTQLTIKPDEDEIVFNSVETDANAGPILRLNRDPGTAGADADVLGEILFTGQNSLSGTVDYARVRTIIADASDPDGRLELAVNVAGTLTKRISLTNDVTIDAGTSGIIDLNAGTSSGGFTLNTGSISGNILLTAAGSGSITLDASGTGDVNLTAGDDIIFSATDDVVFSSSPILFSAAGTILLKTSASETAISMIEDGGVGLYYDGALVASTVTISGANDKLDTTRLHVSATDAIALAATIHPMQIGTTGGANIILGIDGLLARNNNLIAPLQINEAGGNVIIGNAAKTHVTVADSGAVTVGVATGETAAVFTGDGAVDLYHNNIKKLATTALGVDITGSKIIFGDTTADDEVKLIFLNNLGGVSLGIDDASNVYKVYWTDTAGDEVERMIQASKNGAAVLFYNNLDTLSTSAVGTSIYGTGAIVKDGDGTYQPVGLNVMPYNLVDATQDLTLALNGQVMHTANATAYTWSIPTDDSDIPVGATYLLLNQGTGDTLIDKNGNTLYWFDGTSSPGNANVDLIQGGVATLYKKANDIWFIWGSGLQAV